MAPKGEYATIEAAGREARVSNPSKVIFPDPGWTKLDLVKYQLDVAEAVVRGVYDRPTVLKRRHDGLLGDRAALARAREVERRKPGRATSKWWKEERVGVFIDDNQNARDRTVASAYSVRPAPDARVSRRRWSETRGLGDAPWPPHFAKQRGEPKRVQPSRARGE